MLLFPFVLFALFGIGCPANEAPRVKTPLGGIKGFYQTSYGGRRYQSYEGIPYATPPIGKLRFKPPQRRAAWSGELLANKFSPACMQYTLYPENPENRVEGSEDCLYLNVYVPDRNVSVGAHPALLPVIFFIHGGGFQFGTGASYRARYIMDRDVVFVTINYRLGPLGFLSTEDGVVPGNMGLKDQSMALLWVNENIEWFGGDPNRITITGLSAGGASVHYHYLSPLSKGLFQVGLSQSGTALNCWTQAERSLEKTKKLAVLMGCPTSSNKEMMRCLKCRPAHSIVQAEANFMPYHYNPFAPFGPVVEKGGDAPFIDRSPAEIIRSGDVQDIPWITGTVSEEGIWLAGEFVSDRKLLKELNDDWETLGPYVLDFNYTVPADKRAETARNIKKHYFESKNIDRLTVKQFIRMFGDRLFYVDAEKAARMQARANKSPVWFYYFSYRGANSYSNMLTNSNENYGVSHGDDTGYVMQTNYLDPTTTPEDLAMHVELTDLWVSIAEKNAPHVSSVEWPKLDPEKEGFEYLHIMGPGKYAMDSETNFGNKKFWNSVDLDENRSKGRGKDEF